ncbi:MAG: efflux RND transporter periplasmic adaptor subunit [Acidobacteriota bacterium]
MKRVLMVLLVLGVLGAVVFASIRQGDGRSDAVEVDVEAAETRNITQIVKASGELEARVKVELSAHIIAKIEKIYVEEGDEVAAGQPIVELEREAMSAAHESAEAAVEIARANVSQAEIDLADAELKEKRYRRLADEGVVTSEDLEGFELRTRSAGLALERSHEEVRRAVASLEKAADDLKKVTLYAPLSGRVIELNAEEGEVVVTGTMNNPASVIAVIADLSEMLVVVDVDENEIADVGLEQAATITVDALPDESFRGRVVEIGSSGFEQARQPDVTFFAVEVLIEEQDPRLRSGMSARAEIETANRDEAVVVPIQAVLYREPESEDDDDAEEIQVALVVDDNGDAEQRPVEVGLVDETHLEIVSGIAAGENVVVGPYRTLKDLEAGDAVEIREDDDRDDDDEEDG